MEKIHGTSAHIRYQKECKIPSCVGEEHFDDFPLARSVSKLTLFPGGEKQERFSALFNSPDLVDKFLAIFPEGDVDVYIYGEAYGGKCQGMSKTYGKDLRFVAFEVKVGHSWLAVPQAEKMVQALGLEFVHYERIFTVLKEIDAQRDADSVQAIRNGIGPGHIREGIVLRPLFEVKKNNGERVIAKHKRQEFMETRTKREVDPTKRQVLEDAEAIAQEWVTEERLNHVLDQFPMVEGLMGIEQMGDVIKAMVADVIREAGEEILDSKEARKAIGARAAHLYKTLLQEVTR